MKELSVDTRELLFSDAKVSQELDITTWGHSHSLTDFIQTCHDGSIYGEIVP